MTINILKEQLRRLTEQWEDPEFWKDIGCRMDSSDCAQELKEIILDIEETVGTA